MNVFVSGLIMNNNHLLLMYHRKNKAWLQPGGKVNPGESVLSGLYREIREETGIHSPLLSPNYGGVKVFLNYKDVCNQSSPWKIIKIGLELEHPNIIWPEVAPLAVVKNTEVIDLFYCFQVDLFDVTVNPLEHEAAQWFDIRFPEPVVDNLLKNLLISEGYLLETVVI